MSPLDAAERLKEDVGSLLEAGRSVAREYGGVGHAFRHLLLADLALARVAVIRGLVLLILSTFAVGTAWLLAMALIVLVLHQSGLSWLLSLLLPFLASLGLALLALFAARKALSLANLEATRRQWAALFAPTPPDGSE